MAPLFYPCQKEAHSLGFTRHTHTSGENGTVSFRATVIVMPRPKARIILHGYRPQKPRVGLILFNDGLTFEDCGKPW